MRSPRSSAWSWLAGLSAAAIVAGVAALPASAQPKKGGPKPPASATASGSAKAPPAPAPTTPPPAPAAPPTASAPPAPPPSSAAPPPAAPAPSGEDAERKGGPDPAKRGEAEQRFNRGLELLNEEAWTAALAEFMRSRELYPTRTSTNNAAVCLRKLKRFDESLDMYETLLREFPNMTADKKEAALKEVAELRQLVGTIDITSAEPGASIVVDGKTRADFPIIDPIRVSAGTHTVRLLKRGFQNFESTVDVAGGQTVQVVAKMPALVASGSLRIAEKSGRKMDVLLDGATVGVTPWEGTIATGDHVVQLLGDEDLGTQPSAAPVKRDEVTNLTLQAEPLEGALLVHVSPTSANVRIDSVSVGRGIWDGRIRKGSHVVEVVADGYFPKKQEISLEKGERRELNVKLDRDEDASAWHVPSKLLLDLSGGVAITPSFGGDVSGSCGDGCSQGIGLGGLLVLNGEYEFGSGFGLGLSAGALQAGQAVEGRSTTLNPQGIEGGLSGTADDDLRLRGILAGANAAYRIGERFPIRFRAGVGAFISEARSIRTGGFTTRSNDPYSAPALESKQTSIFVYVAPEATVGLKLGDHFELGAGVQALVLIAPDPPKWASEENPSVVVQGDGLSSYDGGESTMGTMVFVVPMLTARAVF